MPDAAPSPGYAWAKHAKQGNRKIHPADADYWKRQGYEIVTDPAAMDALEKAETAKRAGA